MSNPNVPKPKPKTSAGPGSAGNLLSSVAPPSALPNFITTPSPQVSSASSDSLIKKELAAASQNVQPNAPSQLVKKSESSEFLQPTFSPAIPPSKGVPMEATLPTSGTTSELSSPSSAESFTEVQSAHEAQELVGDVMPGSGILTWVKGAVSTGGLLHRVAEKAKNSVDSMITTLDPQMKEYIYSGGDVEVLVTSDKDEKVVPIRDAFQNVFGRATVIGFPAQSQKIAPQPVGFAAALSAAKDRIGQLRSNNSKIGNNVPIVAVESFVIEVTNERWFDLAVLVLTDPERGINLETYTQMTPVPSAVITAAQGDTPSDYQHKETGFSTTIGSYMSANLQTHHSQWHETATSVSRKEMIHLAAKSLATLYKKSMAASKT